MFLSDHHPVSVSITFPDVLPHSSIWCLDPSLLTDKTIVPEIHKRLMQYFQDNFSSDISPMMHWEAHKCVIRGYLIANSVKHIKERILY